MKCILCERFSWHIICKDCQNIFVPQLTKRELDDEFIVYSFFAYNDIAPILHAKHHPHGAYLYDFLGKCAFEAFFKKFEFHNLSIVPIDDNPKKSYSHTAVLAHAIKQKDFKIHYNCLRATNNISYSGKSLSYRKQNKRGFTCKGKGFQDVVLIDDIVTTGTTLNEAVKVMKKMKINPRFALTLADAKVK